MPLRSRRPQSSNTLHGRTSQCSSRLDGKQAPVAPFDPDAPHAEMNSCFQRPASSMNDVVERPAPPLRQCRSGGISYTSNPEDDRRAITPTFFMATIPSRASLVRKQSTNGLKATLRRVFTSKRRQTSVSTFQEDSIFVDSRKPPSPNGRMARHSSQRDFSRHTRPGTQAGVVDPDESFAKFRDRILSSSKSETDLAGARRRKTLPAFTCSNSEIKMLEDVLRSQTPSLEATGPSGTCLNNRKSQSASALVDDLQTTDQADIVHPEMSGESSHWRKSLVVNPLRLNSQRPPPPQQQQQATQHVIVEDKRSGSNSPTSATLDPMQGFDFGLSTGETDGGMDDRVNTLEVKMFDLEYAIAKLQGADVSKPPLRPRTPRIALNPPPAETGRTPSRSPMKPSPPRPRYDSEPSFLHDSTPYATTDSDADRETDMTSKNATSRPGRSRRGTNQSSSPSPVRARLTQHQFETLLELMADERAARQRIEMELLELKREVELLQAPVYAEVRPLDHPTKGHGHLNGTHTTFPVKTLHRSPAFGTHRPRDIEKSAFSLTDSDFDTEDDYIESFRTPKERHYGFHSTPSSSVSSIS